jgi:hypothetical protein
MAAALLPPAFAQFASIATVDAPERTLRARVIHIERDEFGVTCLGLCIRRSGSDPVSALRWFVTPLVCGCHTCQALVGGGTIG